MFFRKPCTFQDVEADMQRFMDAQNHVDVFSIGKTVRGRDLFCWRFRSTDGCLTRTKMNCVKSEMEQACLRRLHDATGFFYRIQIQASMHANEWLTTYALMNAIQDWQKSWPKGLEVDVLPLVNPDGVAIVLDERKHDWKSNANGVDLNDQFPAGWIAERGRRQIHVPGARDYGGEQPLSEPEAIAVVEWTKRTKPDVLLSLHTQGQEIYYNYRGFEPRVAQEWAYAMAMAATNALAVTASLNPFRDESNGLIDSNLLVESTMKKNDREYHAIELFDSDAGCKDWFLQTYRKPAFTIELGCGQNPLPWQDLNEISTALLAMLERLALFINEV